MRHVTTRQQLLAMTATAALLALPVLALAQPNSPGSNAQQQTTQTTPQQGQVGGYPAARAGANAGSTTGQTVQGSNAGSPSQGMASDRNASGGVLAQQNNSGAARDGTPGNPPSTATQRAADSVTGNRTPADGTPGNPPGTAAGRAADRATGSTTTTTTGANQPATGTTNRAQGTAAGTAATGAGVGAMAVDSATLNTGRRASKMIGSTVYNENNESIGEVDDIIIPREGGAPVAVVSVGGFLGIGAKLVAVPYERLRMNTENNRWTLGGATKDSLTNLPTFTYDNNNRG